MNHPLLNIRLALKRLYDHEMAPIMEHSGLTRMELDVLLFLNNNPDHDTAAQIVQAQLMTKSHVSKAVDHLTAMGFLTQTRDETNRRRIHLRLTDEAAPIYREAQQIRNRIAAIMMNGVSNEENEVFCKVIKQISQNVLTALDECH